MGDKEAWVMFAASCAAYFDASSRCCAKFADELLAEMRVRDEGGKFIRGPKNPRPVPGDRPVPGSFATKE